MFHDIGFLVLSLVLLAKGGDMFVKSSCNLSRVFKVPPIVIGSSIVSLATTMPELMVSVTASFMGNSGIALGNAVGSVITNIGLIVGIVAIVTRVTVDRWAYVGRSVWVLIASLLLVVFSLDGTIGRLTAALLLALSFANLYFDYRGVKRSLVLVAEDRRKESRSEGVLTKFAATFLLGAVLIAVGSRILVASAIGLATILEIPPVIVGLSIVAIGTSIPELVTGIFSAIRGVPDLSIGNILGANVLNLTMIIGLAGVIQPLTVSRFTQWYSYSWLIVFVVLIAVMLGRTGVLGRLGGVGLVLLYIVYLVGLAVYSVTGV